MYTFTACVTGQLNPHQNYSHTKHGSVVSVLESAPTKKSGLLTVITRVRIHVSIHLMYRLPPLIKTTKTIHN